jgi:hypothetical protein
MTWRLLLFSTAAKWLKWLIKQRGIEANSDTYFSYTSKDQFDRHAAVQLARNDRIGKDGDLHDEWCLPQERSPGHHDPRAKFPDKVDNTKIHGIAKPHRYWPSQLLRIIEELRLGKMPEEKRNQLKVGETDMKNYAIPWMNYNDIIANAESVDDYAAGIAIRTMEILHGRGLTDEQVIELIIAGYNPKGPVSEHGKIPQVGEIWTIILERVQETVEIRHLGEGLRTRLAEEMRKADYPFEN